MEGTVARIGLGGGIGARTRSQRVESHPPRHDRGASCHRAQAVAGVGPQRPGRRVRDVDGAGARQGRHADAQRYYATALRIVPDEPSVLSNLGLSYALSKDLVRAEATLRRAAAQSKVDPGVRQNLALVVGLQGRFSEAETIAQADLPSDEAAANVAYLRKMLAQQNGWNTTGQNTTGQGGKAPGRPGS